MDYSNEYHVQPRKKISFTMSLGTFPENIYIFKEIYCTNKLYISDSIILIVETKLNI